VYFAGNFGNEFRAANQSGYPLSVAGLNITMSIYQLLGWGFKKATVSNATKRVLFEYLFCDDRILEAERFEKLYCRAMLLLDQEWRRQNATYMQFPIVLAKTQELFVARLPAIVGELQQAQPPQDLMRFN
jgi:hypothetical protein